MSPKFKEYAYITLLLSAMVVDVVGLGLLIVNVIDWGAALVAIAMVLLFISYRWFKT